MRNRRTCSYVAIPTGGHVVAESGRVVIPAEFRRQLDLQPAADVNLDVADGDLRIRSLRWAIERAQALARRYAPEGVSLADELIRERQEAARRERPTAVLDASALPLATLLAQSVGRPRA
jgi:bifunctional DNA-binding transcriptional regulator/antitoxin component of YhaV-PrlF toxin-antitoxin module